MGKAMEKANLVMKNGKVWTVDNRIPWAEAVALRNKEILAVGSNQEIESLIGKETEVISLNGKLVVLGFNDVHTHYIATAFLSAGSFDVYQAATIPDVQGLVQRYSQEHPDFEWLIGE